MSWEGGKLLNQLTNSNQTLTTRLTNIEIELRNKTMAESEATDELYNLKEKRANAEMAQIRELKEKEGLESKLELRKRQIERAMFILRKREELFQNDVQGRDVIQTILKAMNKDEGPGGLCDVRDLEDAEVDGIIYKLKEVRQIIANWLAVFTMGIFERSAIVRLFNISSLLIRSKTIN